MAVGVIWNAIFIGNFAEMDTDESNVGAETDTPIIGTHGTPAAPLYKQTVDISTSSTDGDDLIATDNNSATDTMQFDVGTGPETTQMDVAGFYNGTVTFTDGTSSSDTFVLIQDTSGNVFLFPLTGGGTDMLSEAIESLEITSEANTAFSGANQSTFSGTQFVCFAPGSLILCPDGERKVEDLREGDLVQTLDHGPQPLVWTGRRDLKFPEAPETQKPIEIKAGALGPSTPFERLILSPQHRILLESESFIDHVGGREVLTPAKAMLDRSNVRKMSGKKSVTYHSLLLPKHAVIFANGLAVESLYPGRYAMTLFSRQQQLQILSRVPALMADPDYGYGAPARPFLGPSACKRILTTAARCAVCVSRTSSRLVRREQTV